MLCLFERTSEIRANVPFYKVFLSVEDKYLKLSKVNVSASLKMSFWQQKTGTIQITGDGREPKLCLSAKHHAMPLNSSAIKVHK